MDIALKTIAGVLFLSFLVDMLSDGAISGPFLRRLRGGGGPTRFVLAVARFVAAVGCLASLLAPVVAASAWLGEQPAGATGFEWLWVAGAAVGGLLGFCFNASLYVVFARASVPADGTAPDAVPKTVALSEGDSPGPLG